MNKTELKKFAIQSRRQLIDQVKTKALLYGINEKSNLEVEEQFGQLMINGKTYPLYMKSAFNSLKNQLEQKGYKQLVEEVAYTWFNRIIAIRYMEVHDYLPEKVNVLSSSVGRVDPDILFEYETMDLPVKQEEIRELLQTGDTEGAFRKLFIAQCNALNSIFPFLFEQIRNYTELLLPGFLLDAESVIKMLVKNEELTNSFDEIEVIGWLYQYYIAEEKDRVFAQKSKYKKEEIPFATQLFTPKWIVQYMVQNSLGRYWTEAHREDEGLIGNWEYFIKHEEEDFHEKIAPYVNKELRVEDIKLLDPAMGSGHILVYAFEVFHQIYEKCGYPERDIPRLIIENNLYGLDIDDRAYQLAAFAVVMKATSFSRRFLRSVEREGIQLNLASIQETNHISDGVIAYIAQEEKGELFNRVKAFFDQYHNAKIYGSLINISERGIEFIKGRLEHIQKNPVEDLLLTEQHEVAKVVLPALVQQTEIMRNEYDVVVMNPPYMGSGGMSKELSDFLKKYYPNSKSDLFAAFMEITHFLKENSFYSAINQQSWMFLSSYEKLRVNLIKNSTLDSMLHLGTRAFEEIGGEVVQSTAFIYRAYSIRNYNGKYLKLLGAQNSVEKMNLAKESISKAQEYYNFDARDILNIPGYPWAYWVGVELISVFRENPKFVDFGKGVKGLDTGDDNYFLRFWWEILYNENYWVPYHKGGGYRKWYGKNDYFIKWENNGCEVKSFKDLNGKLRSRPQNVRYYFLKGLEWSRVSSSKFGVRYMENSVFGGGSQAAFLNDNNYFTYFLALLNSKVTHYMLNLLNPTLIFQAGDINRIPIILDENFRTVLEELVLENINISETDWMNYESSKDFKKSPLLNSNILLEEAFGRFYENQIALKSKLKENEEKINKIFISLYKLGSVLNKDIDDEELVINVPTKIESSKEFLSFFIGCLTGRYTLKNDGVVYSGGYLDKSKYILFKPNPNGIIHFTESAYFENDIILRLREFLAAALSPDTVDENMFWLANALKIKNGEDTEERLRRYFLEEFYMEHCKMYQKRPIYWIMDSGKQKGLRILIYMHGYQPDTMATIRFEHLQEIQAKYQNEITDIENRLVNPNLSASEKKKLTAEKTSFEKKMDELREFDKRLAEIANEEIEIDLDDGVKVNYEKFYRGGKGVLAKIK